MNEKIGFERKLVVSTFIFLVSSFLVMGFVMERTVQVTQFGLEKAFDGDVPVQVKQTGVESSNPKKLKAIVKGSIYETGSNMTVFGACFDGDGYLLPEANASFTAWYPNGTIMVGPDASMDKIYDDFAGYHPNGTGRWKIHVTMGDTVGTYLTEMRCEYDGEWSIAFGEWQNPEWVTRIRATQELVQNVSTQIDEFRNETQQNFSDVLNAIDGINISGDLGVVTTKVRELSDMVRAIDVNIWKLDDTNPFFVLGSGTHNYVAVDMLAPHSVGAVSSDGYIAFWDGETWTEQQVSGVEFRGVSVLPSNVVYLWAVGTQNGTPVYSINGANVTEFNLTGGSPTAMNDIKIFKEPNDPSSQFYAYAVGDDGSVYFSNDTGSSWTLIGTVGTASKGRISKVVENYGSAAQPYGYMVLVGQGNKVLMANGVNTSVATLSGTVKDVDLLYYDLGYVVVEDGNVSKIYKFDGQTFTLEYTIQDAGIEVTGVQVNAQDDVWVSTRDPSTFYHFDGRRWEYSTVGYSQYVSVIISFGNGSNTSSIGINDLSMYNSKWGYAVGGDGLIMIYQQHYDDRLDEIMTKLDNLNVSAGNVSVNNSEILDAIADLKNVTLAMNQSLQGSLDNLSGFLDSMNASLQLKADNILSNVTYTNLYLQNTIYPLLDATYQNTVLILQQLGIIEAKVNQTLEISNQTLQIVNESSHDIDELVNRSRRVRAWITQ